MPKITQRGQARGVVSGIMHAGAGSLSLTPTIKELQGATGRAEATSPAALKKCWARPMDGRMGRR